MSIQKNKGITLLETLFALGIVFMLFVFGIKPFEAVRDRQILNDATEDIEAMLQEARSNTSASIGASNYGVHFETDSATYFAGSYYSESDPDNKQIIFTDVSITSVSLIGNGSDVVFNRITGDTNTNGAIVVSLLNNSTKTKTITIFPIGTFMSE
ncbi:hypothetical protein A3I18_01780 [Candidatus Campbellbacteria bacterium RIFCSPLOWO2_02_FULL_35_11]|uniref:General secretion pathway GspH domain-containing protein n=2 Tax=Candidatus Campbelliibacteriota TaxID=1752727 RepID=A0A1F5EQJ0_9BACT|nr:MAG: hypothetical protein A3E89_02005 [Candidatus Campbellbacteria bacterium RIFCSPHIGHO2_12_FULL_35_10]OGD69938.1 MAG: hypothetical protein A3I18_01780 [Candidatus Campbellbacteria bacterium RIFCSPLOWO2_02_FULL_35_11]